MRKRVLFICKRRMDYGGNNYGSYGTGYGLGNSANFIVNFLNQQNIEAKLSVANDANDIDKLVTEYDPTHIFIEALWVTPDKFKEILSLKRHHNRKWIVRIHSKLAFLSHEGIAFEWLQRYRDELEHRFKFSIAPNTKELTRDLKKVYKMKTAFLPNIYMAEGAIPWDKKNKNSQPNKDEMKRHHCKKEINIGCFGAIRPMKNILTQAVAAVKFADTQRLKLRFHLNSTRTEQSGENTLKNLRAFFHGTRHELVEHKWMDHDSFICMLKRMDVGLQVSFSETFDIVAADFVSNNVPIVVSEQISWMPFWTTVRDPNSTDEICEQIGFMLSTKDFGLQTVNRIWLAYYNFWAKRKWLKYLE